MSTIAELNFKIGAIDNASSKIAKISKAVGSGLSAAAKIGAAAVGAAGTALGKMGLDAVKAYADYEQLVGGIETLFGAGGRHFKDFSEQTGLVGKEAEKTYASLMRAQNTVMKNAANAYKDAGLSASEYMETAIGFSGALLKSLGGDTEAAADLTQTAITDMADQANKYGKTVQEISATYTSLARGNYQTLDNLFGGMFAGTKTGLEEMLSYAEKYRASMGETVDYSADSYADILSAIHDVSIATGVYGTTAEEAAKTVSGSFNMLKASWKNFLTGLGDKDANIGELVDQLIESAETLLGNLEPVVMQVLESLGGAVERLGPIIGEKLPGIIMTLLPSLISGAIGLVSSLAQAIPEMLQMIFSAVDGAISESGFGETWNSIKEAVSTAVAGIKENWGRLVVALQPLIDRVQAAWQGFVQWAQESGILQAAIDGVAVVINTVIAVIGGIATAFEATLSAAEEAANWIKAKWQPVADFFSGIAATIEGIFAKGPGVGVGLENIDWSGAAIGNDYVPYNGYPAILHRGEAVLTAREAEDWRQGNNGRGVQMVNNFYGVSQSDLDYIVAYVNRGLA